MKYKIRTSTLWFIRGFATTRVAFLLTRPTYRHWSQWQHYLWPIGVFVLTLWVVSMLRQARWTAHLAVMWIDRAEKTCNAPGLRHARQKLEREFGPWEIESFPSTDTVENSTKE